VKISANGLVVRSPTVRLHSISMGNAMSVCFKRFILLIAAIALLAATSGCAVSEKTCMQSDWQTLGYNHGKDGKSADALNRYVKDCAAHAVAPNPSDYSTGYEAGIALYCTAENGLKVGTDGMGYSGACPAESEKAFVEQYLDGLRLAMDDLQTEYIWDALELGRLQATRASFSTLATVGEYHYVYRFPYLNHINGIPYTHRIGEYYYADHGRIGLIRGRLLLNAKKRAFISNSIREWSGRI